MQTVKIALCLIAFFICCTPHYVIEERQYGVLEVITCSDCIIRIDTVYNAQGGVVKRVWMKVKQK